MNGSPHKIMIISDIHLLAPSLHDDGEASRQLAAGDMKLVLHSDLIMQSMVDEILKEQPALLIITGDLTFNGEAQSHHQLASHLKRLHQNGVRTLVIPGNHDVNNPHSRSFLAAEAQPVATVSAGEFASIYHDYGYDNASERDPASLSYICEPIPGLVMLAIDSNRYDENRSIARGDSLNAYFNGGRVKDATLEWIKNSSTLKQARSRGKKVMAMMHHHLLEHIDGEARMLPNYIVSNRDAVVAALEQSGVHVVFTGHLHITDAAAGNSITDVATGSASTYPLPMRTITLNEKLDTITVTTRFFDGIDAGIVEQGKRLIEGSGPALASVVSRRLWDAMSKKLQQLQPMLSSMNIDMSHLPASERELRALLLRHLQEPLTRSLLTVTRGNENPQQAPLIIDAIKQGVQVMIAEVMPADADTVGDFLIENLMPRVEPMLRSALEDINRLGTPQQSSTPDHTLSIAL